MASKAWGVGLALMLLLGLSGQARADWTADDQKIIDDAGFTAGMAHHCKLDTRFLLKDVMLYIGFHAENDAVAARAGDGYRRKMEEAEKQMADMSTPPPCSLVLKFLNGKIRRLAVANQTKSNISPSVD